MKIFVESSSLEEIRHAWSAGFADGVVIGESTLSGAGGGGGVSGGGDPGNGHDFLEAIALEFAIPICVEVGAIDGAGMYRDARELAKVSDHIIVQLPLVEDAIAPMHKLAQEGVGVCATFVFNGAQAVLAAKAGASIVRVSLHDLDSQGQTSADAVREIRSLLESSACECDVMVASPSTTTQFTECISAGAQIVSIRPSVLQSLLLHPLTDRGVDRFLSGLSRRSRPREDR